MQGAEERRLRRMEQIRRKEERSKATLPFGFAQGRESFDLAQDRELVERQMMP